MGLWYISFAMETGPLGATVVKAENPEMALSEATRLDLNPGGEAAILPVPAGHEEEAQTMFNRFVPTPEILAAGGHTGPAKEGSAVICQKCNA